MRENWCCDINISVAGREKVFAYVATNQTYRVLLWSFIWALFLFLS